MIVVIDVYLARGEAFTFLLRLSPPRFLFLSRFFLPIVVTQCFCKLQRGNPYSTKSDSRETCVQCCGLKPIMAQIHSHHHHRSPSLFGWRLFELPWCVPSAVSRRLLSFVATSPTTLWGRFTIAESPIARLNASASIATNAVWSRSLVLLL